MDIGNAKLAFGLSIKLFDDILKGLHSKNVLPQQVEVEHEITIVDQLKASISLKVEIDTPYFYADTYEPEHPLKLELNGRVTPQISFAGETSPDLFTIDFSAVVSFDIVLSPKSDQAPVIKLEYKGATYTSEPFETKFIDAIFETQELKSILDKLELDVVAPLLDALGNIYYFDVPANQRPSHGQYPVSLQKMRGGTDSTTAMVMFIGTPGTVLNTQHLQESIVPRYAEFTMHAGSEILEHLKEKGKAKIEEMISGYSSVSLSDYTLNIEDNQVDIFARIDEGKTGSYAEISGYFHFRHVPGMEVMFMDGSDVNISVELPWWLDFIAFFVPPLDEQIRYVEQTVPDIMQKTISEMVNNFMAKLDESIQLEGLEIEGLPVEVYPQEIKLDDNSITANIQILTWPIEEDLVFASHGKIIDKFLFFELESGRTFYVDDLVRFMHKGLVRIPGYHQAGLKYIRSNPDVEETNNLEYRFGR